MKYQLVAIFDEESYSKIEDIQRQICRKYRLYKSNPCIYIPISFILNPDLDKLNEIITKVLNPYKKFKVKINNAISLDNENRLVNLAIDEKGYISRISRNLVDTLDIHGFKLNVDSSLKSTLQMPVANSNYVVKKALNENFVPINKEKLINEYLKFAKIDRIELWRLNNNKRESVVKIFPLKQY